MLNLSIDPYPEVAVMAKRVVNTITVKVNMILADFSSVGVSLLPMNVSIVWIFLNLQSCDTFFLENLNNFQSILPIFARFPYI